MTKKEADLILHPVRYRILQTLVGKPMTTQQIADELPSVPVSSIYRHLKTLLEAGLVQVVETNLVKGIEEKVYTVGEISVIGQEEFESYTAVEHKRFFAGYLSFLMKGYADYLDSKPKIDLSEDRVGFTDAVFYATQEELDVLGRGLQEILKPLRENKVSENRKRQLFSVITFPIPRKE